MVKRIETPANCDIRAVIRFLQAKSIQPADIHRQVFFLKGIYWSDSLYIKQGVYNCSLHQLWKIYSFCSYRELQIGIMRTAQKTVGAVTIYCTDGGSSDNILYRRWEQW
jgi:hypothetical protein